MVYQLISTLTNFQTVAFSMQKEWFPLFRAVVISLALMFILGIEKYEKGVVGNIAIVMGVVEALSMKSPFLKILGRRHW